MKIALIGATGNIGSKILTEATARGHDVTAIARNVEKIPAGKSIHPVACDVSGIEGLATIIKGTEAVVVSVDWGKTDVFKILDACRMAEVKRVILVGGASSLEVAPGALLFDSPQFPAFLRPIVKPALDGLAKMREVTDLDWTYVSPSSTIEAGERTGKFRIGGEQLLVDDKGVSRITQEDFSIAILDEVEHPKHVKARFTVGY